MFHRVSLDIIKNTIFNCNLLTRYQSRYQVEYSQTSQTVVTV